MRETPAIQPAPDEACAPLPSTSIAPPAALVQGSESRLIGSLRDAAKQRKPLEILGRAAVAHHQFLPLAGGASLGNALADLAVSGRLAYTAFQKAPPVTDAALVAETTAARPDQSGRLRTTRRRRVTATEGRSAASSGSRLAHTGRPPSARRRSTTDERGSLTRTYLRADRLN